MIDTTSKSTGDHASKHKTAQPISDEEVKKHHCNHGPKAKCVNCLGVDKQNMQTIKQKCNHAPGQKCINCATEDKNLNVKHQSFENYLSEIKAKCKGKHQID